MASNLPLAFAYTDIRLKMRQMEDQAFLRGQVAAVNRYGLSPRSGAFNIPLLEPGPMSLVRQVQTALRYSLT